jgi:hypothetical protein
MAAGTYPDLIQIGKDLTVHGAGVDQTIIDRGGSSTGIEVYYFPPDPSPTVTITGLTVQNALSMAGGGGVMNAGGTLTLNSCAIRDNTASSGAGIYNGPDGILFLANCLLEGNISTGTSGGAGIYNRGSLYVEDTTIRDNHADAASANGGGLLNDNGASDEVKVIRSTLSGNSTEQFGSAIHDQGEGDLYMVNATVSGNLINSAFGPGDGSIFIGLNSSAEILFTTIAWNFAGGAGVEGGIVTAGSLVISDSIVANNDNTNCLAVDAGSITSEGNNIENGTDCGFTSGGDMQNTDPLLGGLADNGGPTWTMALLPGSPAIDAAGDQACADPTVGGIDQRGISRPIGATCDIGAFEAHRYLFLPVITR